MPEVRIKDIVMVSPNDLKAHPKNPNKHSQEQIERLAQIIEYQGWRYPIKVDKKTGFVTSGHGRIEAAKIMGWKSVPVSYQEYQDDDQAYADVISDNAIAEWSELDLSSINNEVINFDPSFDIDLLGIKDFVLEPAEKFEPKSDEDEVPENVEPKTKLGDIYQLGRHRLMCGDSTSIDAVEKLMDVKKADMVFTDPPYGMKLDTDYTSMKSDKSLSRNVKNYKKVAGDNDDFTPALINTVFASFPEAKEVFIWGADYFAELIPDRNAGSFIVWDKTGGNDSLTNIYGSNFELCWSKARHKRHVMRTTWKGFTGHNKTQDGQEKVHPTQKPIKLIEQFFDRWAKDSIQIADLYGGSGSTLIACEKTNRNCFMMELDPHYCDVILARWETYTGQKAELLNG